MKKSSGIKSVLLVVGFIAIDLIAVEQVQAKVAPQKLWANAHKCAQQSKNACALSNFKSLLKLKKKSPYSQDELNLNIARVLYQDGKYDQAYETYLKVSKKSPLWFDALEERAWSLVQAGQINKAIGDVTTLQSPIFEANVSAESFYLSAYVYHNVCDFKSVFQLTDRFKKNQRNRIAHLESLSSGGAKVQLDSFWSKVLESGLTDQVVVEFKTQLPRQFEIHRKFRTIAQRVHAKKLKGVIDSSDINLGNQWLKKMARLELAEYSDVIQNLNLIDADVIQRLHLDNSINGKRDWNQENRVLTANELKFPYDKEDVWLDEIDNYDVKSLNCPVNREVRL